MKIKVIIADDHKIMRDGLRAILDKQKDIDIIGEAADGRETIAMALKLSPDVILMDVSMPDINGIDAARRILEKSPGVKVLALSMHSDQKFIAEMLSAGAAGYLLKDCAAGELVTAVQTVMKNRSYLSPDIAEMMIKEYKEYVSRDKLSAFSILTSREREVLQLIAEGQSIKDIAFSLEISVKTAETYRQHVMDKLELYSIAELTKYAIREGLTTL
jgi:DNA-binding NarL/FixJ family response regulator